MAVKKTIDEMQVAGTTAARTHGKLPRKVRFGAGCKRCALFVANMDPLDLLEPPQRIGEGVQRVSHHSIDTLHARLHQQVCHQIGGRFHG
jgi:hypothetical protein